MKTPSIKALQKELTRIKSHIDDDMVEFGDSEPSMQVTLACDGTGFALQIGDNSFTGSAYLYQHWGVGTLHRNSNCTDLARELIEQCKELVSWH